MPQSRPPYASEFRLQIIELVRAGCSPQGLAKEFKPTARMIRNWIAQPDRDESRRTDGLTTAEKDELHRPGRENRQLPLCGTTWPPQRGSWEHLGRGGT